MSERDAAFWSALAEWTRDMGVAQPAARDISLDGVPIEFHRNGKAAFVWLSSAAIRRVDPAMIAKNVSSQAAYALAKEGA